MGKIVQISLENFQTEVVDASMDRPVVVDFWADWCGPCKQLTPVLEKLAEELDFTLAKINTETNPEIAGHFGVSSIPDVRVVSEGRLVDQIQGALPENKMRELLSKHFVSPFEAALMQLIPLVREGNSDLALEGLNQLCINFPEEKKAQYWLARTLVQLDRQEDADPILASFKEGDDCYREAKALVELKSFAEVLKEIPQNELDQFYFKGCSAALEENYEVALQAFLEVVKTDREYRNDGGRLAIVTLFGLLGAKDPLTLRYRKKLNMYLFA